MQCLLSKSRNCETAISQIETDRRAAAPYNQSEEALVEVTLHVIGDCSCSEILRILKRHSAECVLSVILTPEELELGLTNKWSRPSPFYAGTGSHQKIA